LKPLRGCLGDPFERVLRSDYDRYEETVVTMQDLDEGTAALLEAMEVGPEEQVLDLGCGYGILGLAAAGLASAGHVHLGGSNYAAVQAATATLQVNRVHNATVLPGDVISAVRHLRFDVVVTNPPFHAGVEAEFVTPLAFIAGSAEVLRPRGRLYLVANRFIPYEPYLERVFQSARAVHADNSFKALEGIRSY